MKKPAIEFQKFVEGKSLQQFVLGQQHLVELFGYRPHHLEKAMHSNTEEILEFNELLDKRWRRAGNKCPSPLSLALYIFERDLGNKDSQLFLYKCVQNSSISFSARELHESGSMLSIDQKTTFEFYGRGISNYVQEVEMKIIDTDHHLQSDEHKICFVSKLDEVLHGYNSVESDNPGLKHRYDTAIGNYIKRYVEQLNAYQTNTEDELNVHLW